MKKIAIIAVSAFLLLILAPTNLVAQNSCFTRSAEIPIPEAELNNGGISQIISGVDVDGDGLLEIYMVNDSPHIQT